MYESIVAEANAICKAKCPNCHKGLTGKNQVKYCSKRCELDYRIKVSVEKRKRVCIQCGVQFVMNCPSGKANRGEVKEGQFCSRKCRGQYRTDNKTQFDQCKVYFFTCEICGIIRSSNTITQKVCNGECRVIKSRQDEHSRNIKKKGVVSIVCKECNKIYHPKYGDKVRVFCSIKCSKKYTSRVHSLKDKQRATKYGVEYEYTNANKVFERDGWKCQICGKATPKVRRGSRYSNAPEIDHRIPISKGGPHLYSNIQCACRACNCKKSNNRTVGQLPLFNV